MNNVLGDALQEALDRKKKTDFSKFVWKKEKVKDGDEYKQEVVKLIDLSEEELNKCYNHCKKMLYNKDIKCLGRYNVLDEVNEQINKCNVELFLRYCENSYKSNNRKAVTRGSLNLSLRELKANNPEIEDWKQVKISYATEGELPAEFADLNIEDVIDGCIYYLGDFNKQHLTMSFIAGMGLWFTKAEENELKGENNSNIERLKIARERLRIPSKIALNFNPKGLSFHEMRAILTLPKQRCYSDMTTEQLVTLRDKVLFRLQKQVDNHIYSWKNLMRQIELVAKSKNFNLITND